MIFSAGSTSVGHITSSHYELELTSTETAPLCRNQNMASHGDMGDIDSSQAYRSGSTRKSLLLVVFIFAISFGLMVVVFWNFPELDE